MFLIYKVSGRAAVSLTGVCVGCPHEEAERVCTTQLVHAYAAETGRVRGRRDPLFEVTAL